MGNCTANIRRDLLRVTRLGTGSVNKDRDEDADDDAVASEAPDIVNWKPAGFDKHTTGAGKSPNDNVGKAPSNVEPPEHQEKAARVSNDYRAFRVICKVAKRSPIDLVVRPYETVGVIKRRLHQEHNLAAPEDMELLFHDATAPTEHSVELDDDGALVTTVGAVEGTVLRLVEHTTDEQRLARRRKLAGTPRRQKLDRIQELARHVKQGELFSPHLGKEDVLNRTVPLGVGMAPVPDDAALNQEGNGEVVRARKLSRSHEECEVRDAEPAAAEAESAEFVQKGTLSKSASAKPITGHFMGRRY